MILWDFKITTICSAPSSLVHLVDRAAQLGVHRRDLPLRVGVFGAEPGGESMRCHMESESGIQAFHIYGVSEIIRPGVVSERPCCTGPHVFEDHFYPEIVDPVTQGPVAEGVEGELVLTTPSKLAMPHTITRSGGKAKRVIDRRNLEE